MSFRIRKNDVVYVITGSDKGAIGKVLHVDPKKSRAIVENVNFVTRHRPSKTGSKRIGGIIKQEAPVHISNLMLKCPKCGKPTRIGARITAEGAKERICKKCKAAV